MKSLIFCKITRKQYFCHGLKLWSDILGTVASTKRSFVWRRHLTYSPYSAVAMDRWVRTFASSRSNTTDDPSLQSIETQTTRKRARSSSFAPSNNVTLDAFGITSTKRANNHSTSGSCSASTKGDQLSSSSSSGVIDLSDELPTHEPSKQIPPVPTQRVHPFVSASTAQSTPPVAKFAPLAERMRPQNASAFIGQESVMGKNGFLRKLIESDNCERVPR